MLNKGTTGTIFIRLWYDAVLDWGLNPGPPALEASTLPLGYRGGVMGIKCTATRPIIGLVFIHWRVVMVDQDEIGDMVTTWLRTM